MARLNTPLSTSLQTRATRSSTVDSLYRDPPLSPRRQSNARNSPYQTLSPAKSVSSDKENEGPDSCQTTPKPSQQGGLRPSAARMPTPDSALLQRSNGNKRRRTGDYSMSSSEVAESDSAGEQDERNDSPAQPAVEADEEGDLRFYNPNQDPDKRRRLRAGLRDHQRNVDENRDEMVKHNSKLLDALRIQDSLFGKVRQTCDAALDSRFLLNASELAGKKLNNSLQGNAGVGIDIDQFVSRCIYFIKSQGHTIGEENAPALPVVDGEDEDSDGLDWAFFGRQACFPSNKRPPTSNFLLGPLSVQKHARATQRRARSQRQPVGPATRPQEIKEDDMQRSETSSLSTVVTSINSHLKNHIETVEKQVEEELDDEPDEEDVIIAVQERRAVLIPDTNEVAVNLLDFAINPHDFGQTVENLFYISFLVREGAASITKDRDGLPLLMPAKPHDISEQREKNARKNQAVLSIDYPTWQMFIEAFDIQEPLIPHREPEIANIGATGWYAA